MAKNSKNHKKTRFIEYIIDPPICILMVAILVGVVALLVSCFHSKSYKNQRQLKDLISYTVPNDVDYTTLESDDAYTNTFGFYNSYAFSIHSEDAYYQATKEYGSLKKAKEHLKSDDEYGLDGTLFTFYLSSYLGASSSNNGLPAKEEILNLDNGQWLMYSGYPTMDNGDNMITCITWCDGIFYYVEIAYQDTFDENLIDTLSQITFTSSSSQKCMIPYTIQEN